MPELTSYKLFSEYCLRALGQDEALMIKVNVTEKQLRDRIEDALLKWQDFHFEGSSEVSVKKDIMIADQEKGYIEVPELNAIIEIYTGRDSDDLGIYGGVQALDNIDYRFFLEYSERNRYGAGYGGLTDFQINMEYLASMQHMFRVDKLFTFNSTSKRLMLQNKELASIGGQLIESFSQNNWVAGAGTTIEVNVEPVVNGDLLGTKLSSTGAIGASFTYETNYYPRGMRTFNVMLKSGTYTGRVKLSIEDRAGNVVKSVYVQPKTYWNRFEVNGIYKEPHINDFVFKIESGDATTNQYFFASDPSAYRNNFIICRGYATMNPDEVDIVWNSAWLKEYAIALIKRQWANNIKKFDNVQMAGGVVLNGKQLYDEAITDIEKLETELKEVWSMPPAMMIG